MEWVGKILLSIIEMILAYRFVDCFMERKGKVKKSAAMMLVVCVSLAGAIVNFFFYNISLNLMISIAQLIILTFIFKGKKSVKAFVVVSYVMGSILLEYVVVFMIGVIWNQDAGDPEQLIQFFSLILYYLLKFVVIYFLSKKGQRKETRFTRSEIYIQQALIPLLSILFMIYYTDIQFTNPSIDYKSSYFVMIIFCALDVLLFQIYEKMEALYIVNYKNMLEKQSAAYKENYYKDLESHQEEIRMIRHDMKNKLVPIVKYLSEGSSEKAEAEIRGMLQEIVNLESSAYTRNIAVNAILNSKNAMAVKKGILCTYDIMLPEILKMEISELGTLFGNLMDNAIEACEKCRQEERFLELTAYCYGDSLVIKERNSTAEKVENLNTSKADSLNHGLGLKSIDKIIEKYNGNKNITIEEHRFQVVINLWNA